MARPRVHLAAALISAWLVSRPRPSTRTVLTALAAGVLVDLDHLVDWVWLRRGPRVERSIVPLHGWEWALLLYYRASRPVFWAYLGHLLLDRWLNDVRGWQSYFLTYRALHRFEMKHFSRDAKRPRWVDEPWYTWLW